MTQDPLFLLSANLFTAVVLRCMRPNVFTALILAVVLIASAIYLGTKQGEPILTAIYAAQDLVEGKLNKSVDWPPEKHRRYPDPQLSDQFGNLVKLSDFQGKVILLEPVGMSCPACIAFSGGQRFGAFQGVKPQLNLDSIDDYAQAFGNVRLDDPNLAFVQLLLFNANMEPPTAEEVAAWAKHFGKNRSSNYIVLRGTPELANIASQAMVPGFQLIDKNFILRSDSTGVKPADDLYRELLPRMRDMLVER